jgi:hypothetical protein
MPHRLEPGAKRDTAIQGRVLALWANALGSKRATAGAPPQALGLAANDLLSLAEFDSRIA